MKWGYAQNVALDQALSDSFSPPAVMVVATDLDLVLLSFGVSALAWYWGDRQISVCFMVMAWLCALL